MKTETIDLYYFSGTGNTLFVVKVMRNFFVKQGLNVNLFHLEKSDPLKINPAHTIGLAFPVAVQSTYPLVWQFIRQLPQAKGTTVFMVDTLAGFSGGMVGPLKRILKKKGYHPLAAKEIIMPNNFLRKKIDSVKIEKKISRAMEKAEKFAQALFEGKGRWWRVPLFSDLLYLFSISRWPWNYMRKSLPLKSDQTKCTKCGLCVRLCPIENISLPEYPRFADSCQLCMRCFSFCPTGAITIGKEKYQRYQAAKVSELLSVEA